MTPQTSLEPYIARGPGDLITAEDWNDIQAAIKADLAANAAADAHNVAELNDKIAKVDAPKFGGKTPDEWTDTYDQRYVKRDDPQAAGQYRRFFKQLDRQIVVNGNTVYEPAIIEHKLCRFPLVEVYELARLSPGPLPIPGAAPELRFNLNNEKFLIYYAAKRDPVAELLRTESSDWFYWGDTLTFWLDQFGVTPALTQAFDDLLNDFWGKMFDPGLEQDEFKHESYGHTPYVQRWIDDDKTVGDLVKGGQWGDLRVAVRPHQMASGAESAVQVYHLSQNAVEIRVNRPMDLMVLLRT